MAVSMSVIACNGEKENKEEQSKNEKNQAADTISDSTSGELKPYLGETAQIMIGTQKYEETVDFYKTLGWTIENRGEQPWKWTQMFDGSTTLLVNEDTTNYMGPAYHSPKASTIFSELKEKGVEPAIEVPAADGGPWFNVYFAPDTVGFSVINEAGIARDVVTVADLFYKSKKKITFPNEVSGVYQEYAVSVEDLDAAMAYWEKLGFETNGAQKSIYDYAIMYDGAFILGLHETEGMWHGQMLTYSGHSAEENDKVVEILKSKGFNDIEPIEYEGQIFPGNYIIHDPAGNMFFLTTDFSSMKED